MLNTWTIENFKSLRGRISLPLGRVTALCGANSSGKSSIIHSILMMKQSVNSDQTGRHILLNGHWIKLGTFDDVRSFGEDGPLSIAYSFSTKDIVDRAENFLPADPHVSGRNKILRSVERIEGEFRWNQDNQSDLNNLGQLTLDRLSSLYPPLISAETIIDVWSQGAGASGKLDRVKLSVKPADLYNSEDPDFSTAKIEQISDQLKWEVSEDLPGADIDACLMSNFLPNELIVFFDRARRDARRAASYFVPESGESSRGVGPADLPGSVFEVINSWLDQNGLSSIPYNVAHTPWRVRAYIGRRIQSVTEEPNADARVIDSSELRLKIEEAFLEIATQRMEVQFKAPRALREANAYVRDFFLTGVRYLGPLREEPRAVYPAEALARPDDVGVRGEHTAAVLDLNKNRMVRHIPPFGKNNVEHGARLSDALEEWLLYLGVALSVEIKDAGKFGRQLKVRTEEGGDLHDLTHVGVGVSQVIPILVMSLLAPSPCLLLFEQPELHLHPKVQARLADFFLAMGRLGKQCLLETHSEYMIDRFRLRIAESESVEVLNLVKLYFTEKSKGATICRNVELTEFGGITNWPNEFFDESTQASSKILKAASAKRSKMLRKQS